MNRLLMVLQRLAYAVEDLVLVTTIAHGMEADIKTCTKCKSRLLPTPSKVCRACGHAVGTKTS